MAGRFDSAAAADITFKDELGKLGIWNSASVVNAGINTVYNGVRTWKP